MRKLVLFSLFFALVVAGLFVARPTNAADLVSCSNPPTGTTYKIVQDSWIRLQVGIPGVTITCRDSSGATADYVADMSTYIAGLYK